MHVLTLSLRILISLNSMIRLCLRTLFWYVNPSNKNVPNHLVRNLNFSQIFILTTQGDPTWAVLMYLLTKPNYMEDILFAWVQFLLGIIFKIFIEILYFIFYKLTTNSTSKKLALYFFSKICLTDFSHNASSVILTASKISGFSFNWVWREILFSCFSVTLEEGLMEVA